MTLFRRGRSFRASVGMVARASGGSGGLLQLLERAGRIDQRLEIGPTHCGTCSVEPLAFRGSLALGLLGIRPQRQCGSVRIVQEITSNQILEITLASGDTVFQRAQRRLERQRRQWVAVVEPVL